jgi:hypothetical protein
VRLPFEQTAAIQRWTIAPAAGGSGDHAVQLQLDGPIFEHCTSCGWGVALPTNRSLFDFKLRDWQGGTVMTVASKSSNAAVATVVWSAGGGAAPAHVRLGPDSQSFVVDTAFRTSATAPEHVLYMAFAVVSTQATRRCL